MKNILTKIPLLVFIICCLTYASCKKDKVLKETIFIQAANFKATSVHVIIDNGDNNQEIFNRILINEDEHSVDINSNIKILKIKMKLSGGVGAETSVNINHSSNKFSLSRGISGTGRWIESEININR